MGEIPRPCGVKAQRVAALQDAAGMAELQQQLERLRSEASEADGRESDGRACPLWSAGAHVMFTASAAPLGRCPICGPGWRSSR